jgi:hypothetical protein
MALSDDLRRRVATHWLQHEEQESVSRALAEFFLPAPEAQGLRDKA